MILLPTLNRVKLLRRFIDSLYETKVTAPGLILVDEKDLLANNSAYTACEDALVLLPNWRIRATKGVSIDRKSVV